MKSKLDIANYWANRAVFKSVDSLLKRSTVSDSWLEKSMEEFAKECIIDYENWKKAKGIKWNVDNAHTIAQKLFELYKKEKQLI